MLILKTSTPKRRGPLSAFCLALIGTLPIALGALAAPQPAAAATLTTLHEFAGGNDGCNGSSSLIFDSAANLYGETWYGGVSNQGTVFTLTPEDPSDVVLHSFEGDNSNLGSGGAIPGGSLLFDSAGNLYGTTAYGGQFGGPSGYGTIFKIAPGGAFTTLHNFTDGSDSDSPFAGLVADSAGNLYGTASGIFYNGVTFGYGTIFKFTPDTGTFATLYTFQNGDDGGHPFGDLVFDKVGNLYGTTNVGGEFGYGTVFEFTTGGQLLTLYSFQSNGVAGWGPQAGVILDAAGNLYGTTANGGVNYEGAVFKLTPSGTLTTLYGFQGGTDGGSPLSDLIFDSAGNLYGTTIYGGASGTGTVFRLSPNASGGGLTTFEALASLPAIPNAERGVHGLTLDSAGTLYGTTGYGGTSNCGIVYSIAGVAAPGPTLSPSSKSLIFASIKLLGTTYGNTASVTIKVKGGNYIAQTPLLTGPGAGDFTITSNSCTGIVTGGSGCSISLRYTRTPGEQAPFQSSHATLNLTGDATLAISLVGTPPL